MVRLARPTPPPLERSFANPGPNATVTELIEAIRHRPDECHLCRNVPSGTLVEPEELWIEPLSTWLLADGTQYHGDYGRPYVYTGLVDRIRLLCAVRAWRTRKGE